MENTKITLEILNQEKGLQEAVELLSMEDNKIYWKLQDSLMKPLVCPVQIYDIRKHDVESIVADIRFYAFAQYNIQHDLVH